MKCKKSSNLKQCNTELKTCQDTKGILCDDYAINIDIFKLKNPICATYILRLHFEVALDGISYIYISPATIKVIFKTVKGTTEISRKQL